MTNSSQHNGLQKKVTNLLFTFAVAMVIYMPLHVFIVQSASLITGGIEIWKAAKDILLFFVAPFLLFLSFKRGLFTNKTFRILITISGVYALLHLLFVGLDNSDDTYSAIVGSVYNTRLVAYLLLGYIIGASKNGDKYLKYLLTVVVVIASIVALFGVAQYFLPPDLLTHVGYSLERGVKPLFFIDDKPDFPRVMSTLKDPNSFGAFLILPFLLTSYSLFKEKVNKELFVRPFKREVLIVMFGLQFIALLLTFSRGALIGLVLSLVTLLIIVTGNRLPSFSKRFWLVFMIIGSLLLINGNSLKNSYFVQNVIFHADDSTVLADPNELRVTLSQQAVDEIAETPFGHGPGSAGIVSINNPKGGVLTENYYLQIAYEVGWFGLALFIAILSIIVYQLSSICRKNPTSAVLLSAIAAYLFYSLLIHLWSNEAVALQWWLLAGVVLGMKPKLLPEPNNFKHRPNLH